MKISSEDIARVKGLGCLRDKTTEDAFNVRVITRNGKNWYISIDACKITVNAHSYTIITAHKEKDVKEV